MVRARVVGRDRYIGAVLHRDAKGNIMRPHATEGWYWKHELQAAKSAGLIKRIEKLEAWTYRPCACEPPLREVAGIYALRQQVGKKTPMGIACKLVPNSLYGKFAQSVGSPKYGNPVYASLITAGCRTMILQAIATHPKGTSDVLMVATDGVYFRSRHPTLPCSDRLGDWDYEEKHALTLFKPGVYWDDKARDALKAGQAPVFKARGVNAEELGKQLWRIDRAFDYMRLEMFHKPHDGRWPAIKFPVGFSMVSGLQALMRNNWESAGTLNQDIELKQSSDPHLKRCEPYLDISAGGILRTRPRKNDPYEPSHPYEKRFGMEDPFSDENKEAAGITPEGYPSMDFREALGL